MRPSHGRVPDSAPVRGRVHRRRGTTVPRLVLAALLAVGAVLLVVFERSARVLEVLLASTANRLLLRDIVTTGTADGQPFFVFGSPSIGHAIVVTVECAVALYLAVLLVIGAALVLIRRLPVSRVLSATAIAALGMVLLNQTRLLLLEVALRSGGKPVFEWVHSLVGSTMMLLGLCACLFFYFRIAVAGSPARLVRHSRSAP